MSIVVAQPHSTAGNGGRKLVRMDSGRQFASVAEPDSTIRILRSDNNWESAGIPFAGLISTGTVKDSSIAAHGKYLFVLYNYSNNAIGFASYSEDSGNRITNATLGSGHTETGNVSLTINPQGTELHAAWSSKNSTYPNSFNIRYAKGVINGDGSVTWGAVEQVTTLNNSGIAGFRNPSISLRGSQPVILADYAATGASNISAFHKTTSWQQKEIYSGGIYVQSSPSAVVDKNGVIHVAWHGADQSDNQYKIRYSRSHDSGVTWTPMVKLNTLSNRSRPSITVDKNNTVFIAGSSVDFSSGLSFAKNTGGAWSEFIVADNSNSNTYPSTLYDPTLAGVFGDTPSTIYQADGMVKYIGTYTTNQAPTISVNTPSNLTLYENDTFLINGTAHEPDIGDIVNVWYQVNNGTARAIATQINTGNPVEFSEQLTFKSGKLHLPNGTALTGTLAEGIAHKLKVWSEDNKGGKSTVAERTFYVVPNRAPSLTVDPFESLADLIDADRVAMSGDSHDPDGNDVIVRYRINNGINTEIHNGPAGPWSFDFPLSKLKDGENTIVVEVVDTYDSKSSRTVKLNKLANLTPLAQSVQRYTIVPPAGSAQGVLLWVERDESQPVTLEISMTNGTEPEHFVPMTLDSSGPANVGTVEDFFKFRADVPVEHIAIKLSWTGDKPIYKVSGALTQ